ncbi:hypothetical protein FRC11_005921 [Ceratobasidium sp. 423]|nr:hypothetical protein FRC11_005921 [Ceratobasidium sp. 423]
MCVFAKQTLFDLLHFDLVLHTAADFLFGNRSEYYRCIICTNRPLFQSIVEAKKHEDDPAHVRARRQLNILVPPQPPSPTKSHTVAAGPVEYTALIESSQTCVDQPTIPKTQDISAGRFDVASPYLPIEFKSLPAAEGSSSTHSNQFTSLDAAYWYSNLTRWSHSAEGYFAIPGPVLPTGPPSAVYDLCGEYADPGNDLVSDESDSEDEDITAFISQFNLEVDPLNLPPPSPMLPEPFAFGLSTGTCTSTNKTALIFSWETLVIGTNIDHFVSVANQFPAEVVHEWAANSGADSED